MLYLALPKPVLRRVLAVLHGTVEHAHERDLGRIAVGGLANHLLAGHSLATVVEFHVEFRVIGRAGGGGLAARVLCETAQAVGDASEKARGGPRRIRRRAEQRHVVDVCVLIGCVKFVLIATRYDDVGVVIGRQ